MIRCENWQREGEGDIFPSIKARGDFQQSNLIILTVTSPLSLFLYGPCFADWKCLRMLIMFVCRKLKSLFPTPFLMHSTLLHCIVLSFRRGQSNARVTSAHPVCWPEQMRSVGAAMSLMSSDRDPASGCHNVTRLGLRVTEPGQDFRQDDTWPRHLESRLNGHL